MSQLFGFLINKKGEPNGQSPIPPNSDDAVSTVAGGYFGTYVDVEGVSKNEYELIKRYRDMSLHPEVDTAIDEIINEFVVSDADDSPVEIELSNLDVGAGVKKKIRDLPFQRYKIDGFIDIARQAHFNVGYNIDWVYRNFYARKLLKELRAYCKMYHRS